MDISPTNPVRSERKQPQWTVYGCPVFRYLIAGIVNVS